MIVLKTTTLILLLAISALTQTQTTGRIAGTVNDQADAVIDGAVVIITSRASGEKRTTTTDASGNYAVAFLSPGLYRVRIEAAGFSIFVAEIVTVSVTETTTIKTTLTVAGVVAQPVVVETRTPLIRADNPTLGQVFDARAISELPLPTRNFTQLLGLTAGTATYLVDNTLVGRNTSNVLVNGARASQNNFQINGVDANAGVSNNLSFPNPAPESIAEFKIQTSLYDASFGRAAGGNVQIVTKSGTNSFRGTIYEYFRETSLTANNPFLKAVGQRRPVLERNVFGGTFGGAIKKDRAFFFLSYQTTRERNGASRLNSLSVNVLIDARLTDDRSDATLRNAFNLPAINQTSLRLLNARLQNGQFVIPSPQTNGSYSGSAISLFREDQYNANFDYRLTQQNLLSVKFFSSDAPQTLARVGGANVPGFPVDQETQNRLLSIQDVHIFSPSVVNEVRFGYSFNHGASSPSQPLNDSDLGITRSTANAFPGVPLISINMGAGGNLQLGTGFTHDNQRTAPTTSIGDTVSISFGKHAIRFGVESRFYEFNVNNNILTRGTISFATFRDFLIGTSTQSVGLANGITQRDLRTADHSFFVQDDWKFSSKLTLNLGLRYELDLPPYDTQGRVSTFDPSLYRPRMSIGSNGFPQGPPIGGIVQAGNPAPAYDLPQIPNVGKRVLNSVDPNNFAPRVGFAYSHFKSNRVVVRGGYGVYYSRLSFQYLVGNTFMPPFYFASFGASTPFSNPFGSVPVQDQFPLIVPGPLLFGTSFDRNNRTPYLQQYNTGVQFELSENTLLEIAYAGTHGTNLIRRGGINQARLASPQNPIANDVTGAVITTNTPNNAQLRAPYQGVSVAVGPVGFNQDQTSARSNYSSLQMSLARRFARGLQFLASYTFARSIDNSSGVGGGAGTTGLIDTVENNDSGAFDGDQRDKNSNRGLSDFDRTHRFVLSFIWELPKPAFANGSKPARSLFSNWQMSGIVTAMSGLPINIRDSGGATFFLGPNGGGDRPNWVPDVSPMGDIPSGYFFNPFAFARATVLADRIIPSSNGTAIANATGTDFGNVRRNILRGPRQFNFDISISRRFRFTESKSLELRAEAFNLFNNVNFANPISNVAAVVSSGGSIDPNTGRIVNPGDFGKIISSSNNPRIVQFALKFNF